MSSRGRERTDGRDPVVKRLIIRSSPFIQAAKRIVKRNPATADGLRFALEKLAEEAFQPGLRTHKLKGDLKGLWACSAGYDLRIVFTFDQHEGEEVILLRTVGTHDEVY